MSPPAPSWKVDAPPFRGLFSTSGPTRSVTALLFEATRVSRWSSIQPAWGLVWPTVKQGGSADGLELAKPLPARPGLLPCHHRPGDNVDRH